MRSGATLALLGSPADGFAYRMLTGADPFADAVVEPVAREARHDASRTSRAARRARAAPT